MTQRGGRRLPRLRDVNHEPTETVYRRFVQIIGPVANLLGERDWRGTENVPAEGGVLAVINHISDFDPVAVGMYFIWGAGRWVRYLGKIQIFRAPVLGWLARNCGQIPVERNTERAKDSLAAARHALVAGKLVGIYPEGTKGRDPELWPMVGKTGAARLALETDVPVVPVGQWGAQHFMPYEKRGFPFRFSRHHRFVIAAGEPIDFRDLRGRPITKELLDEATERIIEAITAQVELVRGEKAPPRRWDPEVGGYVERPLG